MNTLAFPYFLKYAPFESDRHFPLNCVVITDLTVKAGSPSTKDQYLHLQKFVEAQYGISLPSNDVVGFIEKKICEYYEVEYARDNWLIIRGVRKDSDQ